MIKIKINDVYVEFGPSRPLSESEQQELIDRLNEQIQQYLNTQGVDYWSESGDM